MMLRQLANLIAIVILTSSCTAYKYRSNTASGGEISKNELTNIKVHDKVFVRLNNGKSYRGRVREISNEQLMINRYGAKSITISYQDISRIRYEENGPVTALKVAGGIALSWLAFVRAYFIFFLIRY